MSPIAEEVGQAFVSIAPSLRGFSSKLRTELATELRGIDGPIGAAGHRAGGTFGDRMREGIGSRLAGIGSLLKTGLVIGAAAATAGLGALTLFGLRAAASLEQTQIGIEGLLGSADEARTLIGELQQFAARTPFEFEGLAGSARRILGSGVATREDLLPTLTILGDIVSATAGGQENIDGLIRALGQIASKGRLMGGEILQIAEQLPGFNANQAIAAHLGVSVAEALELQERGAIDSRTAIDALLIGMQNYRGAAGAMERQSQTLIGVFSTFKDTISIALSDAFQPVIPQIKESLAEITPILGAAIGELAPLLGTLLATALPLIASLVTAIVPILTPLLDGLAQLVAVVGPALTPLGEAIGRVVAAVAPLLPLLGGALVEIIAALVPVIESFVPHLEEMVPGFVELVPALTQLVVAVLPLVPALLDLGLAIVPLTLLLVPLVTNLLSLLTTVGVIPLVSLLAEGVTLLADGVRALAGWLGNIDWAKTWGAITGALSTAWDAVVGFFRDLPGNIGQFLSELPSRAADALNQFAYVIGLALGRTIVFFRELPGKVFAAIAGLAVRLRDAAVSAGTAFGAEIRERFNASVAFVQALPGRIVEFVQSIPGRLRASFEIIKNDIIQVGKDIVAGIIRGITSTISGVGRALLDGLSSAYHGVLDGLGISSPSKVYARIGEDTIAGYVQGVEAAAQQARAAQMAALAPAVGAGGSTATAAAVPQTVNLTSSDPLMSAFLATAKDQIRARFGGNVVLALGD